MRSRSFIAPPAPGLSGPDGTPFVFGEATLWAGDLVAEAAPVRMATVLGSCVAVCLYDPTRQCGGMNHYLVPRGGRSLIHGDHANTALVERMRELGCSLHLLQGKIFGGGSPLQLANENFAVGAGNVAVAHEVLESFGIPIVAENVGHPGGVRLFFENWSGTVWLRRNESGD